jgi:hypothetical protein
VKRFAHEWAAKAASLGWTFEELFALRDPFANLSLQGAAWFIGDSTVTAVTAEAITLRTDSGSTQRAYRKRGTSKPSPKSTTASMRGCAGMSEIQSRTGGCVRADLNEDRSQN